MTKMKYLLRNWFIGILFLGLFNISARHICELHVAFNYEVEDLTVNFTNMSAGEYTHLIWDFGDEAIATNENPTHIYNETGAYNFCLTIKDSINACSQTFCGHVYVFDPDGE